MQSRMLVAVVALLSLAAPASSVLLSETAAREWLQDHPAPQGDELAELKTANPEAYAIVKALLTKRTLGLLDPKHPSASFAPKPAQADSVPSGPEAFQALAASSSSESKNIEYPDVPAAPVHHDWLNWKPKESASDDDSMVKSVLGAVAELKAGKNLRGVDGEPAKGGASEPSLDWANNAPTSMSLSAEQIKAPVAQAAPPVVDQGNSYLKAADLGKDNSYLKSANFAAAPKHDSKQDSTDYLASFSWDDTKAVQTKPETPKAAPLPAQHSNALLSWLGGSAGAGVVQKAAVTQAPAPEQPENPYLSALN